MNSSSKASDMNQIVIQIINEREPQTVKQLITFIEERLSIPENEILSIIINLQNQGKIKLENQLLPLSKTLAAYMKTNQALWYWIIFTMAVITATILLIVPDSLYPLNYIRIALGAMFILCLPGYTITRALFPTRIPIKTATKNLDTIERLALSLGISIAIIPMVGLLLNFTPWGISLTPIVMSLLALTLFFATVAVVREHKLKIEITHDI